MTRTRIPGTSGFYLGEEVVIGPNAVSDATDSYEVAALRGTIATVFNPDVNHFGNVGLLVPDPGTEYNQKHTFTAPEHLTRAPEFTVEKSGDRLIAKDRKTGETLAFLDADEADTEGSEEVERWRRARQHLRDDRQHSRIAAARLDREAQQAAGRSIRADLEPFVGHGSFGWDGFAMRAIEAYKATLATEATR